MSETDSTRPIRCLIIGKNETLHRLDEARSRLGNNWSVCSWPPSAEDRVVPLALARTKYSAYSPCDECFPGRVLPDSDS